MSDSFVDKAGRTRVRKTHCKHGHEFTPECPWATNWRGYSCRVCLVCQRERMQRKRAKPEFKTREAAKMREWRRVNPERSREATRRAYQKRDRWIQNQKQKCKFCPETRFACLDFHHRDGTTKFATIAQVRHWSRERLSAEIAKCDVVCANCHRWLHYEEKRLKSATTAA